LPNNKKAIKRVKITKKKTLINSMRKSALKTAIKKCKVAIQNNDSNAQKYLREAIKAIDRAAAKNILHKNTAARKKSSLMKAYNKMVLAAAGTAAGENVVNK